MPTIAGPTPMGTPLPDMTLADVGGVVHGLHELAAGRPTLVAFVCNHCPYVKHVELELGRIAADVTARGMAVVAVMSNDLDEYPEDGPDGMREQMQRAGWDFPYLLDEGQRLALELGAACTPDLFLFDAAGLLVHRGAFDGSTPKNGQPLDGAALRAATDAVLAGTPIPDGLPPSLGCGIKWSPGNEPA